MFQLIDRFGFNRFTTLIHFVLVLSAIQPCMLSAQGYREEVYYKLNPAKGVSDYQTRIVLHQSFIDSAQAIQDTQRIALGYLYLSNNYYKKADFLSAAKYIFKAEQFSRAGRDTTLLGLSFHKKGALQIQLSKEDEAIQAYDSAYYFSEIAQDSQNMAVSLEQLARIYASKGNYQQSNEYYHLALPMVYKYCGPKPLAVTLINYGSSLHDQDSIEKAIAIYQRAYVIADSIDQRYDKYAALLNLARLYSKTGNPYEALPLQYEALTAYQQHGWSEYVIVAYKHLAETFAQINKADSAYHYLKAHYFLKDSIYGAEVQHDINRLETQNALQQKDLQLLTQQHQAAVRQQKTTLLITGFILLSLLACSIAWVKSIQSKKYKTSLQENRKSLSELSAVLAAKNSELRDLKSQADSMPPASSPSETGPSEALNLYELTILTAEDWQTFKAMFERSYPKYIQTIRARFPDISIAEERLFLFMKLKLSTIESANILGILPSTVKRTKTRLKKRIGLSKEESLTDFINQFRY